MTKKLYHNLIHNQAIVTECFKLAEALALDETEKEKLLIAAWFHDTGYLDGRENHEERSA